MVKQFLGDLYNQCSNVVNDEILFNVVLQISIVSEVNDEIIFNVA